MFGLCSSNVHATRNVMYTSIYVGFLQTKALDLAVNTRTAYDGCKTNAGPMPWQYRLCVIGNMRMTNFALAQLETEARDREVAAALAASEAAANAAGAV